MKLLLNILIPLTAISVFACSQSDHADSNTESSSRSHKPYSSSLTHDPKILSQCQAAFTAWLQKFTSPDVDKLKSDFKVEAQAPGQHRPPDQLRKEFHTYLSEDSNLSSSAKACEAWTVSDEKGVSMWGKFAEDAKDFDKRATPADECKGGDPQSCQKVDKTLSEGR